MANVFKPKRSSTASSVPTTSNLADGELAVNSSDQKIYLRDGASIVEVGNVVSSGISNVVEDTSPQLGGTLDTNGNLIDFGDSSSAGDDRLRFGQSADLQIYHNGSDSYISQQGTGNLTIANITDDQDVTIQSDDGSGSTADYFRADGSTGESILYHYGTQKFATKSTGINITGNITVSGTVDGRDLATDGTKLDGIASGAIADIVSDTTPQLGGTLETNGNIIQFGDSGSGTDDRLKFGAGQDLQIYHNGSNSYISDFGTGELRIISNILQFRNTSDTASMLTASQGGSVELYNNGSKKFETTSNGISITGSVTATSFVKSGGTSSQFLMADGTTSTGGGGGISNVSEDTTPQLGGTLDTNGNVIDFGDCASFNDSDSGDDRLRFGASQDLQIYHVANSNSYIDNRSQHLYIRNAGTNDDSNIYIQAVDGENSIICLDDSSVNLYCDNSLKLQTVSGGVDVTGTLTATSIVKSGGTSSQFLMADGSVSTGGGGISNIVEDTTPQLGGTLDTHGNLIQFGDSGGATDDRLQFGAGNDLQIWHNGANSYISQSSDVGDLYITSLNDDNDVIIQTDSGDGNTADYFRADGSTGEAILYHYGTAKLSTKSTGIDVSGTITGADSVASSANGLRKITASTSSPSGGSDGDIWIKYTA